MTSESQKTRRGRVKKAAEEEEEGFTFFSSGGAGCCRSVSSMLTTLTLREHTNNTNTHTCSVCQMVFKLLHHCCQNSLWGGVLTHDSCPLRCPQRERSSSCCACSLRPAGPRTGPGLQRDHRGFEANIESEMTDVCQNNKVYLKATMVDILRFILK